MDETGPDQSVQDNPVIAAALASDGDVAFRGLCEGYRPELRLHCYRMLGSLDDAGSQLEEALRQAWRDRGTALNSAASPDRPTVRAFLTWLYRIATQTCLDFLERSTRTPRQRPPEPVLGTGTGSAPIDVSWLQPYPDQLLEQTPTASGEPGVAGLAGAAVGREGIQLPFVVALQQLPPRQRVVLILQDVLDWPAHRSAVVLQVADGAVKSLLHRARQRVRELLPRPRSLVTAGATDPIEPEPVVVARFVAAAERGDPSELRELLHDDVWLTMPPETVWLSGREQLVRWWEWQGSTGDLRLLTTGANRQPAVAIYSRRPDAAAYQADHLEVLRIENGRIAEITCFSPHLLEEFRLPAEL